jgi:DNA-binding XRE family transcriptional regulator
MSEPSFIASQQKRQGQSTAYPWHERREPWRTIGREFAAECKAIASGVQTLPPPRQHAGAYEDLRQSRIGKGLTQKALAKLVGCHQTSISDAEAGKGSSTVISLIRRALEG